MPHRDNEIVYQAHLYNTIISLFNGLFVRGATGVANVAMANIRSPQAGPHPLEPSLSGHLGSIGGTGHRLRG